jgi:hypothetical protein
MQAIYLQPILMDKIKGWAAASHGCFPMVGRDGGYCGFSTLDEANADPASRLRLAGIKAVSRAVEKVVRSYHKVLLACHNLHCIIAKARLVEILPI